MYIGRVKGRRKLQVHRMGLRWVFEQNIKLVISLRARANWKDREGELM